MNARLEGGCSVAIAAYSTINKDEIHISGLVGSISTGEILKQSISGSVDNAEMLGTELADNLILHGAKEILKGEK
jgi:hydroxymethylbilane synthase